jgi:hypothetical protein
MDERIQIPVDGLSRFVSALANGAVICVAVGGQTPLTRKDRVATETALREADALARLHAPMTAPPLEIASAMWAARVMQFACRMMVDRIETDIDLPSELASQEPQGLTDDHWSVDLVFRFWWDLMKRAAHLSADDPFNQTLHGIARRWPLAAIGTSVVCDETRLAPIHNHDCLRRLYTDRLALRTSN